jgi:hypothetical protein
VTILKFWTPKHGTENKVLEFYDDLDKTSAGISQQIPKRLLENSLSIDNISSYSGHNASTNFSKHNSILPKLKLLNQNIQRANCTAHILHICTKQAGNKLQIDIESLVAKIFNRFLLLQKMQ